MTNVRFPENISEFFEIYQKHSLLKAKISQYEKHPENTEDWEKGIREYDFTSFISDEFTLDALEKAREKTLKIGLDKNRATKINGKWKTTTYQHGIDLVEFGEDWEIAISNFNKVFSIPPENEPDMLLASLPNGDVNALTTKDSKGRFGVLLNQDLVGVPAYFSTFIGMLISLNGREENVFFRPESMKETIKKQPVATKFFLKWFIERQYINVIARQPFDFVFIVRLFEYIKTDEMRLYYRNITKGFNIFVASHEYSHCVRGHLPDEKGCMTCPSRYDIENRLIKVKKIINDSYNNSSEIITNQRDQIFLRVQALETDADICAIINLLHYRPDENNEVNVIYLRSIVLGAMTCFWYMEYRNRVLAIGRYGSSWKICTHHYINSDLKNYLNSTSHPSPLSRIDEILSWFKFKGQESEWHKQIASYLESIVTQANSIYETVWNLYSDEIEKMVVECEQKNGKNSQDKISPSNHFILGIEDVNQQYFHRP